VRDAAAEVGVVPTDAAQCAMHGAQERREVATAAVRELLLGEVPDSFVGIELGRVGRELVEMKSARSGAECTHESSAMRIAAVPDDEEMTRDRPQQGAQEVSRLLLADVVRVQLKVEVQALSDRRDRDPGDGRDAIPAIEAPHDRGLADRGPSGSDRRSQLEARLVDEDEVGAQPLGVFFTAGQSSRTKRRIAAASRSSASFCGRWWLQPNECRSRPT
jgi:hypothetical protein